MAYVPVEYSLSFPPPSVASAIITKQIHTYATEMCIGGDPDKWRM